VLVNPQSCSGFHIWRQPYCSKAVTFTVTNRDTGEEQSCVGSTNTSGIVVVTVAAGSAPGVADVYASVPSSKPDANGLVAATLAPGSGKWNGQGEGADCAVKCTVYICLAAEILIPFAPIATCVSQMFSTRGAMHNSGMLQKLTHATEAATQGRVFVVARPTSLERFPE
jgi:hypothetical protein